MPAAALELRHIAKRFGQVDALADGSLTVAQGSVHALLGENGAGKSTLMRIAFGLMAPDAGTIHVAGEQLAFRSPSDAIEHGIGMVHQHFTFVPAMTVAENVALGGHGRFDLARARSRVLTIGKETGLVLDPDQRAGALPVGAQGRLEIVKALAHGARTLILDEPTATLAPAEAADLMIKLRQFAAGGGAVVIITHKLAEALQVADDVTVLRAGQTVTSIRAADSTTRSLADAMLGSALPEIAGRRPANPGGPVIVARDLTLLDARGATRVHSATLDVRAGELLGVAGIEGAGQRELLRALAGRLSPASGTISRPERVGFVPEDRHRDALILDFTLTENVALPGAGVATGRMPWATLAKRTDALMRRADVRAPNAGAQARALSGGNQQKLVIARELDDAPDALIVENPTRGLDIAATATVHTRLLDARDAGAAIVMYSSDLDEVLALADRMVVMFEGTARSVAVDRDAAGAAMLGLQ